MFAVLAPGRDLTLADGRISGADGRLAKLTVRIDARYGRAVAKALHRDWYTVPEAAALVGLPQKSIERACRRGQIPAERVSRFWRIPQEGLLRALLTSPAMRPDLQLRTVKGGLRKRRPVLQSSRAKTDRMNAA